MPIAPLIAIHINGHTVNARLCDTATTRHHGLAGTPAGSRCACVMIWHRRKLAITLGAEHLHQPYYIFTLTTTPTKANSYELTPLTLKPRKTLTVYPSAPGRHPRQALIEIPAPLATELMLHRTTYGTPPPPTRIGQLYYPNQRIIIQKLPPIWAGLQIHWHIPTQDAQNKGQPPKPKKPNDPQ